MVQPEKERKPDQGNGKACGKRRPKPRDLGAQRAVKPASRHLQRGDGKTLNPGKSRCSEASVTRTGLGGPVVRVECRVGGGAAASAVNIAVVQALPNAVIQCPAEQVKPMPGDAGHSPARPVEMPIMS